MIAVILIFSLVVWHLVGVILAALGLFITYFASLRFHPRIRHGRCNGTGEHRGSVFTWTHRRCGRCNGGRLIRWGAGQFGAGHIQAEADRSKRARAAARDENRWR